MDKIGVSAPETAPSDPITDPSDPKTDPDRPFSPKLVDLLTRRLVDFFQSFFSDFSKFCVTLWKMGWLCSDEKLFFMNRELPNSLLRLIKKLII